MESYTPDPSYIEISDREGKRFWDLRLGRVKIAHPSLSDEEVDKLMLRAWLQTSMLFDKRYLPYLEYVQQMDHWTDTFVESTTTQLKNIIAIFEESLVKQ